MIYARALGHALGACLEDDERVVLLGEDITDPYGGAFKVTRGLSTRHPDRVLGTPISEAAIVGIAAGLALAGRRPVVEIMFGDFVTLAFDQVLNHITKYEAMYAGQATCPVVVRTAVGGHRGYGPTHSQSPEKHLLGVPHLRTVAASPYHDPAATFRRFLSIDQPVLFLEHKMVYPLPMQLPVDGRVGRLVAADVPTASGVPTVTMSAVPREHCTLTVVAYGYQAVLAARVVESLAVDEEVFVELVVPGQIAPLELDPVLASVAVTGRALTVEEGTAGWSWGTEIAARLASELFGRLRAPTEVLASVPTVIPASHAGERAVLVDEFRIRSAVLASA